MAKDENYELLKYQIKMLQMMLSSVVDDDKFIFYNFVIDHNIPQSKVNIILKSLDVLKNRILNNKVSSETKDFCASIECLSELFIDKEPTFKEYESFIQKHVSQELNTRYLLLSLKRQGIHIDVCEYLLKNMNSSI